jgi:hypothetical protein
MSPINCAQCHFVAYPDQVAPLGLFILLSDAHTRPRPTQRTSFLQRLGLACILMLWPIIATSQPAQCRFKTLPLHLRAGESKAETGRIVEPTHQDPLACQAVLDARGIGDPSPLKEVAAAIRSQAVSTHEIGELRRCLG